MQSVDSWAANSEATRARAVEIYGLDPGRIRVIHPAIPWPDDAGGMEGPQGGARAGLLVVSPLVPYKRDDLAVRAASRLGIPLTVAGEGPERRRLEGTAGPSVRFTGRVADRDLRTLYRQAAGLLFCGRDDFGLVPVEAMAHGCPVLAFRGGGAVETVREGTGGLFFDAPEVEAVLEGIGRLLGRAWDPVEVRASVSRFQPGEFERRIREWVGGPHDPVEGDLA